MQPVDWDTIELDWRTGLMTKADICRKHGVSLSQLNNAVNGRGWVQEIITPEDEATVLGMAEQPRFPCDSIFSSDEIKRQVLMTAGQVVKVHRDDIAKLRGISSKIMEKLEQFIVSNDISGLLYFLGSKDSVTDLLEKLSRIMVRIVDMERAAYGLTSMTVVDNEQNDQLTNDIRNLNSRLKLITEQKAQRVEPKPDDNIGQNNAKAEPPVTA